MQKEIIMTTVLKLILFSLVIPLSIGSAQVAPPILATASGTAPCRQTVTLTLTESTPGATIFYTTDGTAPTNSSRTIVSGGNVMIALNQTLQAEAMIGSNVSPVVSSSYTIPGAVAAGDDHTILLRNDSTVWASGDDSVGQLGNNDSSGQAQPVPVPVMTSYYGSFTPLSGIVAVSAGAQQSFAVDSYGQLWAWGYNQNGELGTGSNGNLFVATLVSFGSANPFIIGVATAGHHTLALAADGTVWAWGSNASGQLGIGSLSTTVTVPTEVSSAANDGSFLSSIVSIAAGDNHSLALDASGRIWTWGANASGQLGSGTASSNVQEVPQLNSNIENAVEISAGASNSYALLRDGTVRAWGANDKGQAATGSPGTVVDTPGLVGGLNNVAVLANALILDSSGTIKGWGDNTYGRLGTGVEGGFSTLPVSVDFSAILDSTLADQTSQNQTTSSGGFSNPLTVTLASNGQPLANSLVNFVVSNGGGLLAASPGSSTLSDILQVLTDSEGHATVYLYEPTNSSGSTSIVADAGDSQSNFTVLNSGTGVPFLPSWAYPLFVVITYFGIRRYLPAGTDLLRKRVRT